MCGGIFPPRMSWVSKRFDGEGAELTVFTYITVNSANPVRPNMMLNLLPIGRPRLELFILPPLIGLHVVEP